MVGKATVLVVKIGEDDPIDSLFETLSDDNAITLESPRPVGTGVGMRLIRTKESIGVVIIIGREPAITPVVTAIRSIRADLHIIALAVETGTANLSLRDASFQELTHVIRALAESRPEQSDRSRSGKILRFRAGPPGRQPGPSPANLPVPIEPEIDPKRVEMLDAAVSWVELATRNLIKIWSGRGDETPAFALTWEALERWLAEFVQIAHTPAGRIDSAFRDLLRKLDDAAFAHTPLAQVVKLIRGDEIAIKLFLTVLVADLDIRFHRLFGALHDDLGRRYASLGLACAVIAAATDDATPVTIRAEVAALERLRALGLVHGLGRAVASADEPLRIEPACLDWLLTADPERLIGSDGARLVRPTPENAIALLSATRLRHVRRAVRRSLVGQGDRRAAAVLLTGSVPGWIEAEAGALAGPELRIGPPSADISPDALQSALRSLLVASRITGRRLVVDLMTEGPAADAVWRALAPMLAHFERRPYLVALNAARLLALTGTDGIVVASLPAPSIEDRGEAIAAALGQRGAHDPDLVEAIADRFQIALQAMPDAVAMALSAASESGRPTRPEAKDWLAGFRRMAASRLPRLARRLEPDPCPDDRPFSCLDRVILPQQPQAQLRSLIQHVRFSRKVLDDWGFGALVDAKGVAALFTGESGTGKTMAAHAVASELATDLFAVDLAQIVSKYIGETEKNLDVIFDDAERAGAVLLFDEADALFGKRSAVSDAHDRYANIEVAYLLQRMQQFAGLAILASNHPENIDPAFTRRLRFNVAFPRPSAADRLRIWEQSIPPPIRAEWLDLKRLAFALDVTGGIIRQMALHAAVLAAEAGATIAFDHLLAGARAELIRLGSYGDLPKLEALSREAQQARAA
ncbi:MAG TPA: ATP-binding protein [Beijerinckiaceae bacterium]|nr:ATP-binding protein [Beijerinckiaceae bacterium]